MVTEFGRLLTNAFAQGCLQRSRHRAVSAATQSRRKEGRRGDLLATTHDHIYLDQDFHC